jgi:lipid-binding SYLF domain-containing protein
MHIARVLFFSSLLLIPVAGVRAANVEDYSATLKIFRDDPITRSYFENAYGYAVFPKIGKGAVGLGAAFGKGQVYHDGRVTGLCRVLQLSIGFQLGGQAFSEIIFFQDKRAYDEFTSGSFELDAKASAVAITAGAQVQTGTTGTTAGTSLGPSTGKQLTAHYVKGMAIFVHIKGGLMYEAAVGGQKFSFDPI